MNSKQLIQQHIVAKPLPIRYDVQFFEKPLRISPRLRNPAVFPAQIIAQASVCERKILIRIGNATGAQIEKARNFLSVGKQIRQTAVTVSKNRPLCRLMRLQPGQKAVGRPDAFAVAESCLLYTSPSPRDA